MKDQINIENYEAFYLDYLEGNLDENATLALFAFLADNPELQVEDLGPELMDSAFVLDNDFKNNLKQDQNSSTISTGNIEYFLTAEKENQLSKTKLAELDSFISAHPKYKLDRKIYALSTLKADKNEVFKDKSKLKQRETIVLWPLLSVLAAACAVLVIWLIPNSPYNGEIRSAAGVPTIRVKGNTNDIPKNNSTQIELNQNSSNNATQFVAQQAINPSVNKNGSASKLISGNLSMRKAEKIETLFAENVVLNRALQDKNPDAVAYRQTEVLESPSNALAMTNPVKPLTNKLSDIIKTQVDYKSGEDAKSERKGFYLKIGQFEISQNKKIKQKQ
jgi:hypothetical protein|tara:strand:- start:10754 stop:11755 length:1002 start_codon:yes stop_codon:yes gene_type:complete